MVKVKMYHSTFPHTLNYLMQSFKDSDESDDKRFKVVAAVLKEFETGDIPSSQSSILLSRICVELVKFKTEHLVNICSICVEAIQKGTITNMRYNLGNSDKCCIVLNFLFIAGRIFCPNC